MAFEKIASSHDGGPSLIKGVVRVGIHHSGKNKMPCLAIVLASDIAEALNLSPGTRVDVQFGTGDDFGKIRVQADANGIVQMRKNNGTSATLVTGTTLFPDWVTHEKTRRIDAAFTTDAGALYVTVPDSMIVSTAVMAVRVPARIDTTHPRHVDVARHYGPFREIDFA